eukprot:2043413-Pyramimonas_sp.AAC.1
MRCGSFPKRWGKLTRPGSLNRRPAPGRGRTRGLMDLCGRSITAPPLAKPVRDALGVFSKDFAPRRYQSKKSAIKCFAQSTKLTSTP